MIKVIRHLIYKWLTFFTSRKIIFPDIFFLSFPSLFKINYLKFTQITFYLNIDTQVDMIHMSGYMSVRENTHVFDLDREWTWLSNCSVMHASIHKAEYTQQGRELQ